MVVGEWEVADGGVSGEVGVIEDGKKKHVQNKKNCQIIKNPTHHRKRTMHMKQAHSRSRDER